MVTLEEMLAEARSHLARLTPNKLMTLLPHGALVLDTRTPSDRSLYGCIPGSIHTPRTVLEWRVAPDAPLRRKEITGLDQLLVVVCNEGFSSSLAAVSLQRLGFVNATDLEGGVLAWRDAGFPLVPPNDDEVGMQCSTP